MTYEEKVELIADLLHNRDWPEPAESNEEFARLILDTLGEEA